MAKSAHASNKKGTPIGVNDMHIAGHARSQGLILVTNNLREFERIDGLRSENWIVAV
ncbi:PIN domain-containing protein [Cellvibrio sp. UBA7661]|uniref:PIN domain-containing protein n=1 Tax=Cellvibrio sp. UBA7661 TaxID=1946311 RepID=UPI0032E3FD68